MAANVYQMVTDRIVEELKKGVIPWQKPWAGCSDSAISYATRKPYSLLNQLLLGDPGEYLTFNQVKERGGNVKKGAKAKFVVFFKIHEKKRTDPTTGADDVKKIPMLRYYHVFHLNDTEGIQSKLAERPTEEHEPIERAEEVIRNYVEREGLTFENDRPSDRAFFSPPLDKVVVPMLKQYRVKEEYYSTTFHELTHSTMKASRCDREAENKLAAFGSKDYSREELVAEIGSAMLCNRVGIESEKAFRNSVAYINGWLKALANDEKMIVWASARAEKAAQYILNEEAAL